MSFLSFWNALLAHPWAIVALILNFGVAFVNGWTDAPNSIATVVTSRCLRPKKAVTMCAILNCLGCLTIGAFSSALSSLAGGDVSKTIATLIEWDKLSLAEGELSTFQNGVLMATACGLFAVIAVSLLCTAFSFPSSQSNCLIGGITGAGMALTMLEGEANWFVHVNPRSWLKVILGFFGSILLGFLLGFLITKAIQGICHNVNRGKANRFFRKGEIVSSGLLSYMHGIQDGSKFIGVFLLVASILSLQKKGSVASGVSLLSGTWWVYVPVALVLGGGTMMGGYGIIKKMGTGMAKLHLYQAFATEVASVLGLLLSTFFGLPISTGSIKSMSIAGSGAARSFRRLKYKTVGGMVFWGFIVFPSSALVAFLLVLCFQKTI